MADPLAQPAFWVTASVTIYLVAAIAGWRLSVESHPRLVALRLRWMAWPFTLLVAGALRFLYYLGIPYLAIVQGSIDLRTFGLVGADLPAALLMGLAVAVAAWAVLAVAWRRLRSSQPQAELSAVATERTGVAWVHLLDTVFAQAHWALYRSWPILVLGTYPGVFAGLGLAAAESLVGLLLSRDRRQSGGYAWERGLTQLGMAWVTSLVFLAGGSLLACLLVHAGLILALQSYIRPAPDQGQDVADGAQ